MNDDAPSVNDYGQKLFAQNAKAAGRVPNAASVTESLEAGLAVVDSEPEGILPKTLPNSTSQDEAATVAQKMARGESLSPNEGHIAEAIIFPALRPPILVQDGDYDTDHPVWSDYAKGTPIHQTLTAKLGAIGRINLPDDPRIAFGGTGFIVGPNLIITNRHVAEIFVHGTGVKNLRFVTGQSADIGFQHEFDRPAGTQFDIVEAVMIHPYFDMALLKTTGLEQHQALTFLPLEPEPDLMRKIAVVGYPAFDPRNNTGVQNEVFGGVFDVKRLQPGFLTGRRDLRSFGKIVSTATHDASTLGGNSGSAVLDAETGKVVALHFAGIYRDSNFAVAAVDLAQDQRVVDAGLSFEPGLSPATGPWSAWWSRVDRTEASTRPPAPPAPPQDEDQPSPGGVTRYTVPVHIDVSFGAAVTSSGTSPALPVGDHVEKMVEPFRDPIEVPRNGYDPEFLSLNVPLPQPLDIDDCALTTEGGHVLHYHNFSLVMNKRRRLAMFTAANVDGSDEAKEPEAGFKYTRRSLSGLGKNDREKWFSDPRIRGTEQLPDRFFTKDRASFDKGHLVRRDDVAWGATFEEVRAANGDTYHTTNCAPQVAGFNRSNHRDNWGALEDLVLKQAKHERYCVFSGPVLLDDDPDFAGVDDLGDISVKIPRKYWKVIVSKQDCALQAFAFVLHQDLSATAMEFAVPGDWISDMVSIDELEEMLGSLTFPSEIHDADQFGLVGAEVTEAVGGTPKSDIDRMVMELRMIAASTEARLEHSEAASKWGRFDGLPIAISLNDDGQSAQLLKQLTYFGPEEGREWPVPEGAWLDGASIPRAFWTLIGSPYRGRYREASVVHDHYCITKDQPWQDVHRMFYNAMRARGVGAIKARIMFYAVYRFGPRWDLAGEGVEATISSYTAETFTPAAIDSVVNDVRFIAENDMDADQIAEFVRSQQAK